MQQSTLQKPPGFNITALLLVVLALMWIAIAAPLITVYASFYYARVKDHYFFTSIQCVAMGCVACFAIFMGYAALGLACERNHGRVAGIFSGGFLAVASTILALAITATQFAPNHNASPLKIRIGLAVGASLSLGGIACGLWLMIYLNLSRVKAWIRGTVYYLPSTTASNLSQLATSAPIHGYIAVSDRSPADDRSPRIARGLIWVFAILLLVGAIVMLIYSALALPLTYLGIHLQGKAATAFCIVFAFVNTAIAIGLMRRITFFYKAAIGLEALGVVNRLLLLTPSYRMRAAAFAAAHYDAWRHLSVWSRILRNAANSTLFILFLSLSPFFLWALWRDLASISQSSVMVPEVD